MAMDLTFGYGVAAFIFVGLLLLVLNYLGPKSWGKKAKQGMAIVGVILILSGGFTYFATQNTAVDEQQNILTPSATFSSVASAPSTHTTIQNNSHLVNVAMTYNTTSNLFVSSSNIVVLNFTVSRADSGITDAIGTCSLGSVPVVGITGAASQPIVALNTDNSYNALFAKAGGFSQYEHITVLVEPGSSSWARCTITANAAAVDGMTQYQVMQVPLNIAGTIWTVNFQLVSILS
jgi:hypothetical protein